MKKTTIRVLSVILAAALLLCLLPLLAVATGVDITRDFTDLKFRARIYILLGKADTEPIWDSDVAAIEELWVPTRGIQSLAGLQHFTGLKILGCYANELAALPALPAGLEYLHCQGNALETLPALPAKLWTLDCGGNALTSLPALPKSLRYLYCKENLLAGLDVTGLTLFKLDCSRNAMTTTHSVRGFTGAWDGFNFIYSPQDAEQAEFIPVTGVAGLPTAATAGTPLALSGEVTPADATNRTIVWSVASAGTTGAAVADGVLNATAAGTATLRATVADGTAPGVDFQRTFSVAVSSPPPPPPPPKMIFSTKYEATFPNWLMFIFLFGFIWMWF